MFNNSCCSPVVDNVSCSSSY